MDLRRQGEEGELLDVVSGFRVSRPDALQRRLQHFARKHLHTDAESSVAHFSQIISLVLGI